MLEADTCPITSSPRSLIHSRCHVRNVFQFNRTLHPDAALQRFQLIVYHPVQLSNRQAPHLQPVSVLCKFLRLLITHLMGGVLISWMVVVGGVAVLDGSEDAAVRESPAHPAVCFHCWSQTCQHHLPCCRSCTSQGPLPGRSLHDALVEDVRSEKACSCQQKGLCWDACVCPVSDRAHLCPASEIDAQDEHRLGTCDLEDRPDAEVARSFPVGAAAAVRDCSFHRSLSYNSGVKMRDRL